MILHYEVAKWNLSLIISTTSDATSAKDVVHNNHYHVTNSNEIIMVLFGKNVLLSHPYELDIVLTLF